MDIIAQDLAVQAMNVARAAISPAFGGSASPTALLRWRRAIARMRTAEAYRPLIALIGDSKTAGVGTDPAGQFRFATSLARRLSEVLTARGLPAACESMWGSAGTSLVPASLYDPRRSGFSGWTLAGGIGGDGGIGGEMVTTTGTGQGVFTPTVPVDRCRVFFKQGESAQPTAAATVTVDADATVRATLAGASSPAYVRSSVIDLGSLATHAIKLNPAGGAPFYLAGVLAWNSTVPAVDIANIGVSGVKASWQTTTARLNWLGQLAPDLAIINLGSNDMLATGATDLAAFSASVQAIVAKVRLSGDVVLVFPAVGRNPASTAQAVLATDAQRAPYRAALAGIAAANDCLFIDEQALLGGRDKAQALGLFVDSLHETGAATVLRAHNLASALLA